MDSTLVSVVGSVGGTVIGVVLGARLSRTTAREIAREEREWQESRSLRARQESAAERLGSDLINLQRVMPREVRPPADALGDLVDSHRQLREAWTRASLLTDHGIDERVRAFDMALTTAVMDSQGGNSEPINYWVLGEAAADVRKYLDAFLRNEEPPAPAFLSAREQIEVMGSSDRGLNQVRRAMTERRIARRAE